jgi:CMP-N,N'-diacetyllegionaminic acid synthase
MTILCVIGARGGSQGLPGKNIKLLLGKPLITWSIESALKTVGIDRVVVSTDSEEIATVAREAGAETPFMRPEILSGQEVGKFDVWKHALECCEKHYNEEYEIYIDLDCTNPLRDPSDISNVINQLRNSIDRGVDTVFSVCEARKNPYFNMVEADKNGAMRMSKTLGPTVIRRQDAPQVYEHVASIYAMLPSHIKTRGHLLSGHAEGYDISLEKSLDVDSEFDFELVECLMKKRINYYE